MNPTSQKIEHLCKRMQEACIQESWETVKSLGQQRLELLHTYFESTSSDQQIIERTNLITRIQACDAQMMGLIKSAQHKIKEDLAALTLDQKAHRAYARHSSSNNTGSSTAYKNYQQPKSR